MCIYPWLVGIALGQWDLLSNAHHRAVIWKILFVLMHQLEKLVWCNLEFTEILNKRLQIFFGYAPGTFLNQCLLFFVPSQITKSHAHFLLATPKILRPTHTFCWPLPPFWKSCLLFLGHSHIFKNNAHFFLDTHNFKSHSYFLMATPIFLKANPTFYWPLQYS